MLRIRAFGFSWQHAYPDTSVSSSAESSGNFQFRKTTIEEDTHEANHPRWSSDEVRKQKSCTLVQGVSLGCKRLALRNQFLLFGKRIERSKRERNATRTHT